MGVLTSGHKGAQGGAQVVGGRGQVAEHMKSGEKKEKKKLEHAQKRKLLVMLCMCWELTTLWVARLDDGAELKVTDPKEQQGDVKEEETKGEERRDRVDCRRRRASC